MIQTRRGFRFPAKTLQMRVGSPMPQPDHFESDNAVETFLSRAIYDSLTATTDFLEQFVVAKISRRLCPIRCFVAMILVPMAGVIRLAEATVDESTPATGELASKPRPASNKQAVQRPSGASAKIAAPHFRQTLGALLMMRESPARSSSCTARNSVIRYVCLYL